jgi:hypothetical protein
MIKNRPVQFLAGLYNSIDIDSIDIEDTYHLIKTKCMRTESASAVIIVNANSYHGTVTTVRFDLNSSYLVNRGHFYFLF